MNHYIDAQCKNMIAVASTFQQACEVAARQDDGQTSREEKKMISKINAATEKYKSELLRISSK